MILVTGASGTAGSATLNALLKESTQVKALYRTADAAKQAPTAAHPVVGDYADESFAAALNDVDRVFLVCGPVPDLVALESKAIDACMYHGMKHIVLFSALGAGSYAKSFPSWHTQVENKLKASGVTYTILRPNSFMQNLLAFNAPTIRTQNAFYGALRDSKMAYIDIRNVGEFAAKTLTTSGHENKVYELNGPEAPTQTEIAALISDSVHRTISYVDLMPEQLRQGMLASGLPPWLADALVDLQAYYTSGYGGGQPDDGTVERVIGHPQTRLRDFIRENSNAFSSQAMTA